MKKGLLIPYVFDVMLVKNNMKGRYKWNCE
jgi:hypothetical protein